MSFTIRKIRMTLDPGSIAEAIRQVEDVRDRLYPALVQYMSYLADKGVEIVHAQIMSFSKPPIWTGLLYESIIGEAEGPKASITANTHYAMYVEFGTGMHGEASSTGPKTINGYTTNPETGEETPTHVGTYSQKTGWRYYNEELGRWVWTTGMEARPFMYNSYRELEAEVEANGGRIIAEYLA